MDVEKLAKPRLIDFERPRLDDKLYQENNKPHGFIMDQDGLPKPAIQVTFADTEAADLTPERFVCMADPTTGRVACSYYKRQLLPSEDKQHTVCIRHCSILKSESGETMDLGNTEILACDFRFPRDLISEKKLDDFDAELTRRQQERRAESKPFNVDEMLEQEE